MLDIFVAANPVWKGTNKCAGILREFVRAEYNIVVGHNADPENLPNDFNRMARHGKGEFLLFLRGDIIPGRETVDGLLALLSGSEEAGIAVPRLSNGNVNQAYLGSLEGKADYTDMDSFFEFARSVQDIGPEARLRVDAAALLTRRSDFEAAGGFDPRLHSTLEAGTDYALRLLEKGKLTLVAGYMHCNLSAAEEEEKAGELEKADWRYMIGKWSLNPNYSLTTRSELLERVRPREDGSLRVLDVGCAAGGNLCSLSYKYPGAELYGIELNRVTARWASRFGKVLSLDVERLRRPEWQGYFDYILAPDIIEHLRNHYEALLNLRGMLKPEGHLLLSLPNFMYIGNLMEILGGNFKYKIAGILDATHLRFFTRQSIEELLPRAGLKVAAMEPHKFDIDEAWEKALEELLKLPFADKHREDYLALQWLVDAVRDDADGGAERSGDKVRA